MRIYEALSQDHRYFESLLDRMDAASRAGSDEWKSLLDELRNAMIPHAHAEEAVFYNALRDARAAEGLILPSFAEHGAADLETRALGAAQAIDANWTSMVARLREDLLSHIRKEETEVFAAAKAVFSEEEAERIGEAFARLKPEYADDADSMALSTKDLIANLMPRRFAAGFRQRADSARRGGDHHG